VALKPVLEVDKNTRVYLTQRWKALRLLKAWGLHLSKGGNLSLEKFIQACKDERDPDARGISIQAVKRVLRKDDKIQDEVLQELRIEASLAMTRVMSQMNRELDTGETPPNNLVRIGEFLARYGGGQFLPQEGQAGLQVGIQINLPPDAHEDMVKVEHIDKAKKELGGLLDA